MIKILHIEKKIALAEHIQVRFYELDDNGAQLWEAFPHFDESDVHRQFGIAVKTPAYPKGDITSPVSLTKCHFRS